MWEHLVPEVTRPQGASCAVTPSHGPSCNRAVDTVLLARIEAVLLRMTDTSI